MGDPIHFDKRFNFFSKYGEDLYIYLNYINTQCEDGTFLEVGAGNGHDNSPTFFFESILRFKGFLIEPNIRSCYALETTRPKSVIYNYAIDSTGLDTTTSFLTTSFGGILTYKFPLFPKSKPLTMMNMVTIKPLNLFNFTKGSHLDLLCIRCGNSVIDAMKTISFTGVDVYIVSIDFGDLTANDKDECKAILSHAGFVHCKTLINVSIWMNPSYSKKERLFKPSGVRFDKIYPEHRASNLGLHPHTGLSSIRLINSLFNQQNRSPRKITFSKSVTEVTIDGGVSASPMATNIPHRPFSNNPWCFTKSRNSVDSELPEVDSDLPDVIPVPDPDLVDSRRQSVVTASETTSNFREYYSYHDEYDDDIYID